VVAEVHATTGHLWENFAPDASARGSWSQPDYSWTALPTTALLYEIVLGVQPDALANRICWHLPDEPGWGLQRIPLGDATIDLLTLPGGRIQVVSDRRFTLQTISAQGSCERRIAPGRWDLPAIDNGSAAR
jgi:hypothetical protein